MVNQDNQILRVYPGMLRGTLEKVIGILNDILVYGIVARNHNDQCLTMPPPCSACLLPGAGYTSRITGHHADLQLPDIDA
ncbi:hypothetical protein D3C75_527620 [compost metagenome]